MIQKPKAIYNPNSKWLKNAKELFRVFWRSFQIKIVFWGIDPARRCSWDFSAQAVPIRRDFCTVSAGPEGNLQDLKYSSGPNYGAIPILTLEDDVQTWESGDKIVVASTSWDANESEVFEVKDCPECRANQVKIDRTPTNTHWGRIDPVTGIDQRAEGYFPVRFVPFIKHF